MAGHREGEFDNISRRFRRALRRHSRNESLSLQVPARTTRWIVRHTRPWGGD